MSELEKIDGWVAFRNEEPIALFENRKKAVKYLKELLKQTLKDFNNQDKTDEFDYPIEIRHLTIRPIKYRESYLGL